MVEIAPALIDAIREQRAVLFLGAGASVGAKHPRGDHIPQGDRLRDLICDKFLGGALKHKPLTVVAAIAANEVGIAVFQKYIHDLFVEFDPADFHLLIAQFRWRAIATTNVDLIIEKAYAASPKRLQNLVKSVKDGDNLDIRLNAETNPVAYYKLHGCIDSHTDLSIPLILGTDQYASYEANRTRFYARFKDLGHEYPIIFAGYSLSDPHIQRVLFDLTDASS
jgi:SIR2-like domain